MIATWHLGPDRAAEWRAIRLEALRDAPDAYDSTYADWADRPLADFAARLASGRVFAAGRTYGEPLAVAAWDRGIDPRDDSRGWVMSVYATPAARGAGFAEAVLRAVLEDAAAHGMTSVGLNVVTTNAAAIALYRRLGFADSGRQGVSNSRGAAEIEMLRPLP